MIYAPEFIGGGHGSDRAVKNWRINKEKLKTVFLGKRKIIILHTYLNDIIPVILVLSVPPLLFVSAGYNATY